MNRPNTQTPVRREAPGTHDTLAFMSASSWPTVEISITGATLLQPAEPVVRHTTIWYSVVGEPDGARA
jgi:hypothetical protein